MDKLDMQTKNIADENYMALAKLFPNALTEKIVGYDEEGKAIVERAIDVDVLRQEISCSVVEGRDERYQFTWPDKKKTMLSANAALTSTLRPIREESSNFDDTENLYIEGDNLEVLKILQETYLNKIRVIYVDPPYNTGNDFVYRDKFVEDIEEYVLHSGQVDENGNRLIQNTENNGRFHTDWLNMMYSRMKMARSLLSDNGIIFISIGQAEIHNMINLMNEIYGESNHISTISRVMKSGGAKGRFFSPNMEYILVYCKDINNAGCFREPISEEVINKLYTSVETEGERKGEKYRPFGLYQSSLDARPSQRYYIECPDGELVIPPGETMPLEKVDAAIVKPNDTDGCWRWSRERYIEERARGNIAFKESNGVLINSEGKPAKWNVYTKIWLSDRQEDGMVPVDLINKWENRLATKELGVLGIPFDFAKPVDLIKYLISLVGDTKHDIVMDFFSGSATTAHAVMQLNEEDNGHRKFIMIQWPEETNEKSEARAKGYNNICEIGKERIRRAGNNLSDKNDVGFRVLKVDSSNMKDIYYNPSQVGQQSLFDMTDNIKEDRTPEDLLFQVMLDLGVLLSSKIEEKVIAGKKVFNVAEGFLIACFDYDVTEETVKAVAQEKPYYAVFRDSSMANDSVATNFEQIFATYSPETVRKVL